MKCRSAAIVSFPPFSSGLTQYSYFLCKSMSSTTGRPAQIFLVCSRMRNKSVYPFEKAVDVIEKTRFLPVSVIRMLSFLLKKDIQIIHFQSFFKYPSLTYCLMLCLKLFGKKIIFTAHDIFPHYRRFRDKWFCKKIYMAADGVVVHSEANRCELMKFISYLNSVAVIPHPLYSNFSDTSIRDKCLARKRLGISDNDRVILFFGRIDQRKGAEMISAELHKIVNKEPRLLLVMAGSSAFPKDYLPSIAIRHNVGQHLKIVDHFIPDEEVPFYFAAADAVILPYLRGSTSGVLKVAFVHKKPVIVSKAGELPELVRQNNAGIVIDLPLSDRDITQIVSLLSNPETFGLYDDYEQLIEKYSWERAAKNTWAFYKHILQK